jgi:hypothetical protein
MVTRNGDRSGQAVGSGMTRPILAHLAVVTAGAWVFYAIEDVRQGGDLVGAPVAAGVALVGFGVVFLAALSVLLVPAMVLTVALVDRLGAASRGARLLVGAASWTGWGLFVAITLAGASRLVLVPEAVAADLLLLAVAGAGFSVLAFGGSVVRTGRAFAILALAVVVFVVVGSIWMAGRWGGPV